MEPELKPKILDQERLLDWLKIAEQVVLHETQRKNSSAISLIIVLREAIQNGVFDL